MENYTLKKRNFACFVIGFLLVFIIQKIELLILGKIDINTQIELYLFYIPTIYTILIEYLKSKLINDGLTPDKYCAKGQKMGILFLILKDFVSPIILSLGRISSDNIAEGVSNLFLTLVFPSLLFCLLSFAWSNIMEIRLKFLIGMMGGYDEIVAQHNKEYEEFQKKKTEGKFNEKEDLEVNEDPDLFDISGSLIKKVSSKLEKNIKK